MISTRALAVFAALCLVGRLVWDAWQRRRCRQLLARWVPAGPGPLSLTADDTRASDTIELDRRPPRGVARADREATGLLPPAGSWCGCCGRPCDERAFWCADCASHVGNIGQPHDCTWSALHDGAECPFADRDDDDDCTAEGLGPRIERRMPSPVVPVGDLDESALRALAQIVREESA
jgi:hypothetical protein